MEKQNKPNAKKNRLKRGAILLSCVAGAFLLIIAGYIAYVLMTYNRIGDNQTLTPRDRVCLPVPFLLPQCCSG